MIAPQWSHLNDHTSMMMLFKFHQFYQKLFDALEVPAVQFANQSTLAAYATGRKTAMVVDCGPEVTWLVAVMDGYSVQDATMKLEVGGTTITKAGCGIDALFNPSTVGQSWICKCDDLIWFQEAEKLALFVLN